MQPRALDWGSRASQETRFDVLVQIDDLSGCSVLDVGCAKSPRTDAHKFLAEPAKVLEICLNIAPKVVLRHDYMAHDFTVYLYRSGAPDPSDHG